MERIRQREAGEDPRDSSAVRCTDGRSIYHRAPPLGSSALKRSGRTIKVRALSASKCTHRRRRVIIRAVRSRSQAIRSTPEPTGIGAAKLFGDDELFVNPNYERIQSRLFSIDEWNEYEQLESELEIGKPGSRAEKGTLLDALEKAEVNSRRAHALYCNAVVARETFEIDARAIEGALREQARSDLVHMHKSGQLSKAPTKDDIDAHLAAKFTDKHRELSLRRTKMKQMVENLEHLADTWKRRRQTLDSMVRAAP
ncbi:MAG: hypothetical protein HC945_03490 [Nitrosarchaeum sp.]|nr:hypothetical protein [Nitrosarchaeum sp.]